MKRYLVVETSKATEQNPNFAGTEVTYTLGVGDYVIGIEGSYCEKSHMERQPIRGWDVMEYGYKRMCDAKRNWTYKNPENNKYWQSTTEIIEVDI